MLTPTRFSHLPSVRDILADGDTVFVIPTFQRPYAWGEKQIQDLGRDLQEAAGATSPQHYFAQAHLVEIGVNGGDLASLLDNEHQTLQEAIIQKQNNHIRSFYAVIDGQQRLVTLYLLSIMQELVAPSQVLPTPFPNLFKLMLPGGSYLPRIILGTQADHAFFAGMVDWLLGQIPPVAAPTIEAYLQGLIVAPNSPAQQRLKAAALSLLNTFFSPAITPTVGLIANHSIKMGITELDTHYALTSFITLNDRGKSLSVLERLKSLWLQRAVVGGHGPLVMDIHHIFGDLYRVADRCAEVGLANDVDRAEDLLCQLLYHWLNMEDPSHELWYGAETVYEWFRDHLYVQRVLPNWVDAAKRLRDQISHLCDVYLSSSAPAQPSIHYPNTSTLHEDYFTVLIRLGLPPHLLALLLRFRNQFQIEWHERFDIQVAVNPKLIQPICDQLSAANRDPALVDYRHRILARLPANGCAKVSDTEDPPIVTIRKSILEAVERITVLASKEGSNPRAGFISRCGITFGPGAQVAQEINAWYVFCNWTGLYDCFYLDTLCHRNAPSSELFLFFEWERFLIEQSSGTPVAGRQGQPSLQLEHILPKSWQDTIDGAGQTFSQWGFRDAADFERSLLNRIGNKALLWEQCNQSVGNNHPDIKARHYIGNLCNHAPQANALKHIEQLGSDLMMLGLGPSPVFKHYMELRCAELATFALQRLC
ncbi:DUF262 domain-containing protein [Thiorhodococcus mannitoliphagus]|uniref:DUF262 domain-containing protein n=1 Tax=Thiorhodococcus mannitoliphagus TaxID=329406 RepID=A0A6P1E4V4_9GAMM|nr:DUF262 domain-containing protein [Thiorhodococcus mannitoliphagus]NEX23054.1 DUF262 domain-containing protein [Thiorhodococcus mannitoliphagus]